MRAFYHDPPRGRGEPLQTNEPRRPGLIYLNFEVRLRVAVFADGIDGATFEGFHALIDFFLTLRLLENVAVTAVILTDKVLGGGLAAEIAIDALRVYVEFAGYAFGALVVLISHRCVEIGK
jgi:hypothetical protein